MCTKTNIAFITLPCAFSGGEVIGLMSGFGKIWLDDLNCTGKEMSLMTCGMQSPGLHNCYHSEDVAIRCGMLCFVTCIFLCKLYYWTLKINHLILLS